MLQTGVLSYRNSSSIKTQPLTLSLIYELQLSIVEYFTVDHGNSPDSTFSLRFILTEIIDDSYRVKYEVRNKIGHP